MNPHFLDKEGTPPTLLVMFYSSKTLYSSFDSDLFSD